MPNLKDFLYFITNEEGLSGKKTGGLIEFVATPTPLAEGPDGYQDKTIKYTRNSRYGGVFRTFTTPLKFVKDGAMILRDQLIKFGTEAKLFLVILWLDKSFGGGLVHRSFYKGEFDLANAESEETHVTANIMEGGLMKFLKANESTQYEIPLNVPEAVMVKSDGIPIDYSNKWGTVAETLDRRSLGALERYFYSTTLFTLPTETSAALAGLSTQSGIITDYANSVDYFIETAKDVVLKFNLHFKFHVKQSDQSRDGYIRMSIRDEVGTILNEFLAIDLPDDYYEQDYEVNTVVNLTVPKSKKLFIGYDLQVRRQTIGSGEAILEIFTKETEFTVEYTYTSEPTFVRHLRPAYVAQQLLNKITGSTDYTFTSNYLTTVWDNLLMTSGNAIRGIDSAVIKTSWNEFFDSYNVPCNIMMGISGKTMYIEKYADQFKSDIVADLGGVNNFIYKINNEPLFSSVKIGYPDVRYENVNGKYEFNTTQTYVGPITKVTRAYELTSKYRADSYGYEFIRIEGAGKDTTDLQSDNDVFLTHVEKTATVGTGTEPALYYKFLRNTYASITGLIKPTDVWNLEISPKRCLLNHSNRLRSVFYWQSAANLKFESALKDTLLKTVDGSGNAIEERANVFIGNLGDPIFIPIEFRVEGKINRSIINAVEASNTGTIQFSWDDEVFYGFVMDIGIQAATLASQETVLLCSPNTNLNKLIF